MNERNKQSFIVFYLLSRNLKKSDYAVHHAVSDADTLIVNVSLSIASEKGPVTVVADDTDVLVLLLYHFKHNMSDIFMSEMARRRSARMAVTPIHTVRNAIGDKATNQLLVIHAISGCDTTSALLGQGKVSVFKNISRHNDTVILCEKIESLTASRVDVVEAGCKLMTVVRWYA